MKVCKLDVGGNRKKGETYVDGADEVVVSDQQACESKGRYHSANPRSDEPFDGLFGRQFDELCASE